MYNYHDAVSRNIGWVSEWEQLALRHKTIAIAGMGGVGGAHLITLTRLGMRRFHISDLDEFEVANFNRQTGATLETITHKKVEILTDKSKSINPDAYIKTFPKGINKDNIDEFLDGVDLFVDGFDFFMLDIRAKVFARCNELGIPAVTAAPIGMGTSYLIFLPGHMTFEAYFRLEGFELAQQYVRFAVGLTPAGFHRHYLIDPTRLDLEKEKGPSTIMAVNLCAGVLATEVFKILLRRGTVYPAPYYHQFDAFTGRFTRGKLRNGNNGLLQRLKCKIGYTQFKKLSNNAVKPNPAEYPNSVLEDILDLARWAPSGDNEQPWCFKIKSESIVEIYCQDTRNHCVYDLEGHASEIAIGALLASIEIAATGFFKTTTVTALNLEGENLNFEVQLQDAPDVVHHSLLSSLPLRATQRRPFSIKPLSDRQKTLLQDSVGDHHSIVWLEGFSTRLRMARLLFHSAYIRLTIPEAYLVHKNIIEWGQTFSTTKIPDQAVGLGLVNLKLMNWAMKSWSRVQFFNRFLAGTFPPRIQLDFLPALFCGAHFLIVSKQPLNTKEDHIEGGKAMQRFWLTATRLGLEVQPEMTPLIFSQYTENNVAFTQSDKALQYAKEVKSMLSDLVQEHNRKQGIFMGRIGTGKRPASRSIRKSLFQLTREP